MPSRSSNKNLRALLPVPPPEGVRCISVPVPDEPQWIAAFYGALQRLSLQSIWDRDEAHTAQVIAERWLQVYLDTLAGDCMADDCDDCLGRILKDPATGAYGYMSDDPVGFYRFPDGAWVDSPIDTVWPAPQPYTVGSDDERRCIAARNATLVLRQLYQETWGVFIDASVGAALSLSSAIFQFFASLVAVSWGLNQLLEVAKQMLAHPEAFTDPFPDEDVEVVQNILYCNSSIDEDGVVTFDYAEVVSAFQDIVSDPFAGLVFLLELFLHEDGLNTAGGIHNEDEADCSSAECAWCNIYDFATGEHGFSIQSGRGFYQNNQYESRPILGTDYLDISKTFGLTNVNYVRVQGSNNASSLGATRRVLLFNGATIAWQTALPSGTGSYDLNFAPNVEADQVYVQVHTSQNNPAILSTLNEVELHGIGTAPEESNC